MGLKNIFLLFYIGPIYKKICQQDDMETIGHERKDWYSQNHMTGNCRTQEDEKEKQEIFCQ